MHVHVNSASQGTDNIVIELFGDHPAEFLRHLLDQNHVESTVGHYLRCIGNLAEMMKAHGIALAELDEAQAVALITKTGWNRKRETSLRIRSLAGYIIGTLGSRFRK